MEILYIILIAFGAINVLTFMLYAIDKRRAKAKRWRISERLLIFFTIAGGGFGAFLGMGLLRHKTNKTSFRIARAIGFLIAASAIGLLLYFLYTKPY